jgi:hypothetical protein
VALKDDLNRALRKESPELLADTLGWLLRAQPTPLPDWRDLLVSLAPIYDCARRLGVDPVVLFDDAAQGRPAEIADLVREFARRDDITPAAFHFTVDDTPDGLAYRWE